MGGVRLHAESILVVVSNPATATRSDELLLVRAFTAFIWSVPACTSELNEIDGFRFPI